MENVNILRDYGLFDAKVPRYTSYPPANRFLPNVGARFQHDWLSQTAPEKPVSLYVHIPFCRRLCWFCACRTQGTQTLHPVDGYLVDLIREIEAVARLLPKAVPMGRLHLGGGTPTLLSVAQMTRLLDAIETHFAKSDDYEFSVEIDPTEAAPELLDFLETRGMNRASIGVQDFDLKVQEAIGRLQSFEETRRVVDHLRGGGVGSLNIDLLYGLPFQTADTLVKTLEQVSVVQPERIALYGYAHVPHMSKRQVMIPEDELPDPLERFEAAQIAKEHLVELGYMPLGIDHFVVETDSLAIAARDGKMRRNFQGYTDDPCETLIGFGASAISKYPKGYIQNAVATAAYQQRVRDHGLAGHKGYVIDEEDLLVADVIDQVMCRGKLDEMSLLKDHAQFAAKIPCLVQELVTVFPNALHRNGSQIMLQPGMEALARVIAAHFDQALHEDHIHSAAI
ncbi:MAG: oxygen-independent coproporphyrinogen III oxidase [Pseudomonadota bacterium]